jgi:hypothetical protein
MLRSRLAWLLPAALLVYPVGAGLGDFVVESREHVLAIGVRVGSATEYDDSEDERDPHGRSMTCRFRECGCRVPHWCDCLSEAHRELLVGHAAAA